MAENYASKAVSSVLSSEYAFCKFLSANDTGATGGHQSGILISKSASVMMFPLDQLVEGGIVKRKVKINWQDDFTTESGFSYYESKGELRITRFGRGFPFLKPEQTGALFVFTKQDDDNYSGFFLETENEIEDFLNTFGIGPTQTNRLIETGKPGCLTTKREDEVIEQFISGLSVDFPSSEEMSLASRRIENTLYNRIDDIVRNPDRKLVAWTDMEYRVFRALEHDRYREMLFEPFVSVDEFVKAANIVLNRRKSRAGKSLEHHLAAIFDGNELTYSSQVITEGNKKPDFIFPSGDAYHDIGFPTDKLISLAAKTTCKDRWRQVLNEVDRLRDKPKYLCTLQQGISGKQMDEMQAENVTLVVPQQYIKMYPADRQDRIWSVAKFIEYVKETGRA